MRNANIKWYWVILYYWIWSNEVLEKQVEKQGQEEYKKVRGDTYMSRREKNINNYNNRK